METQVASIADRLIAAFAADGDPLWKQYVLMLKAIHDTSMLAGQREDRASAQRLDALLGQACAIVESALRAGGH
jgi:hypothetical protein